MPLTITHLAGGRQAVGAMGEFPVDITFDSSYAKGGEPLTDAKIGTRVFGVQRVGGNAAAAAYTVQHITSTNKLQVLKPAPALIVEEVVAVSSNVGTLQRVPGYILAIEVTAGSVTGAFLPIPVGETPVTTQVAVNFLTGGMTFLAGDAVTSVRVTYIPLGVGPFIEANRVVDEAVTLATAGVNLANRAGLIQYVFNSAATGANRLPAIQPVGEAPSTNQIAIDIQNSGNTTITPNSAQNTNAAKVTYWRHSAFAGFGWTDQADITVTSNAIVVGEALDLGGTLIPGFGCVLVGEATATNKQQRLLGPSGTVGADLAVFDPAKGTITFHAGDSITTCEIPYIVLNPAQFTGNLIEVPNGENLSGVTIRALVRTYPAF